MLKQFHDLTKAKDNRLKELYRTIRKLGNSDITQLKHVTGFKHATCVRLLEELLAANLIDDSEVGISSGGRKPKVYRINAEKNILVGVEIAHLYTTIVLQDLNLVIKGTRKLKMTKECTPTFVLDFIATSMNELVAEFGYTQVDVLGLGVGLLTKIKTTNFSITAEKAFSQLGWDDFNIQAYLSEKTELKVLVESATNLAVLAEYRKKYWNNIDELLFVSSDLIIRSAAISNGYLLYKQSEMVEGLGHMIIQHGGQLCDCGATGCLQTYSTLPVVYQEVIKQINLGAETNLLNDVATVEELTYYHILAGMEAGDPLCRQVMDQAAEYFSLGLSNLILQLRPQEVIIGGTLGLRMFDQVAEKVNARLTQLGITDSHIQRASASFNTVSQGAGCLVLDDFVEEAIFYNEKG